MNMTKEAVLERLDACIQFMEETKKFIASAFEEAEPKTVEAPAPAKKAEKKAEPPKVEAPVEAPAKEEAPAEKTPKRGQDPTDEKYADLVVYTAEELADILTSYDVELPEKSRKKAYKVVLMDAVLKAVEDGIIPMEDESDETAVDDAENGDGQEASEAGEEESESGNDADSEADDTDGDDQGSESDSAEESEFQVALHQAVESGEIKMSEVKKFLSAHFADDDECKECKGCSKEETITCYVQAMEEAMTDDEGEIHDFSDPYVRGEEVYCCGLPCNYKEKEDRFYCVGHCKQDFQAEEDDEE